MDNYSIIDQKSQSILSKLQEKMEYKEKLLPYLAEIYRKEGNNLSDKAERKIENLANCGKEILISNDDGSITGANFCKHRLCPICNYRRSTMLWHKVKEVIADLNTDFLLVTLTVKNCTSEELSKTIDNLLESFHRITSRRSWKAVFVGFIRGLEITYNYDEDTFHPHIHILVSTTENYFKEQYIDIHTLRTWWRESARLDYHVQVDIRKVSEKDNAIAEVVKYAVKTADILESGQNSKRISAAEALHKAIAGRRLMSTGGNIKRMARRKKINLDDDDIENISQKKNNSTWYKYSDGKYIATKN